MAHRTFLRVLPALVVLAAVWASQPASALETPLLTYGGEEIGFDYPAEWGRAALEFPGMSFYLFRYGQEGVSPEMPSFDSFSTAFNDGIPTILLCLLSKPAADELQIPEDLEEAFRSLQSSGGELQGEIRSDDVELGGLKGLRSVSYRLHPESGDVVQYAMIARSPGVKGGTEATFFLLGIGPRNEEEEYLELFDAVGGSLWVDLQPRQASGETERHEGFGSGIDYPRGWDKMYMEAAGTTMIVFTSTRLGLGSLKGFDLEKILRTGDTGMLLVIPEAMAEQQKWAETSLEDENGTFREMLGDAPVVELQESGEAWIGSMTGRTATYRVTDANRVQRVVTQTLGRSPRGPYLFFMGSTRKQTSPKTLPLFERMRSSLVLNE